MRAGRSPGSTSLSVSCPGTAGQTGPFTFQTAEKESSPEQQILPASPLSCRNPGWEAKPFTALPESRHLTSAESSSVSGGSRGCPFARDNQGGAGQSG